MTTAAATPVLSSAIGFFAAALTTVSLVPQLVRIWQRRSAEDISTIMFSLFSVGVLLWLVYGIMIHSWPMIAANGVTLVFSIAVLVLKYYFGRPNRRG